MKIQYNIKIGSLLFSALLFFSCSKKDDGTTNNKNTGGYNCVSGSCQPANSGATFGSLDECEAGCGGTTQKWTMVPISTPPSHSKDYDPDVTCQSWQVEGLPLRFSTCARSDGSSGFYVYENTGQEPVEICWTIYFNTASSDKGCRAKLPAGEVSKSSCSNCSTSKGGAKNIELTKYEVVK